MSLNMMTPSGLYARHGCMESSIAIYGVSERRAQSPSVGNDRIKQAKSLVKGGGGSLEVSSSRLEFKEK